MCAGTPSAKAESCRTRKTETNDSTSGTAMMSAVGFGDSATTALAGRAQRNAYHRPQWRAGGASSEWLGVIAVLRTLTLGKRTREDRADEFRLGKRVALLRLHGETVVCSSKPALQRDVLGCNCWIAA